MAQSPLRGRSRRAAADASAAESAIAGIPGDAFTLHCISPKRNLHLQLHIHIHLIIYTHTHTYTHTQAYMYTNVHMQMCT